MSKFFIIISLSILVYVSYKVIKTEFYTTVYEYETIRKQLSEKEIDSFNLFPNLTFKINYNPKRIYVSEYRIKKVKIRKIFKWEIIEIDTISPTAIIEY